MEEHEKQMDFRARPGTDLAFGGHFIISEHTHLEGRKESEILPWLKLAAELDPQKIETYTVAAYWLRDLGKTKEAERFLREGLLNNPDSYEILFDLGRLYYENHHDAARARKIWDLALRRWGEQEAANKKPDLLKLDEDRRPPLAPGGSGGESLARDPTAGTLPKGLPPSGGIAAANSRTQTEARDAGFTRRSPRLL